jgi:hypothetical protein
MDGNIILVISIWAAIGLSGLSILALVLFGLRNLTYGKVEPVSIAVITFPAVLLVVLGVSFGTWAYAGIVTVVTMFAFALVGLAYTGITNLIW